MRLRLGPPRWVAGLSGSSRLGPPAIFAGWPCDPLKGWTGRCHVRVQDSPTVAVMISVGHGAAGQAELCGLLRGAGVARLVDVRRAPGSRLHPHVARAALTEWLPAAVISCRWEERLGGRRRLPEDSPDVWWQVDAFRA